MVTHMPHPAPAPAPTPSWLRRWRAPLLAAAAVLVVLGSLLALAARGEAAAEAEHKADVEQVRAQVADEARSCRLRPHYGCP